MSDSAIAQSITLICGTMIHVSSDGHEDGIGHENHADTVYNNHCTHPPINEVADSDGYDINMSPVEPIFMHSLLGNTISVIHKSMGSMYEEVAEQSINPKASAVVNRDLHFCAHAGIIITDDTRLVIIHSVTASDGTVSTFLERDHTFSPGTCEPSNASRVEEGAIVSDGITISSCVTVKAEATREEGVYDTDNAETAWHNSIGHRVLVGAH